MKKRFTYGALMVITLVLGLASRKFGTALPEFIAEYAGDTLWALMVYWLLRTFWPKKSVRSALIGALSFSFLIEFSQLYQADWINELRANRWAALVLGRGFLWTDLLCYTVGILIGVALDATMLNSSVRRES